MHSGVYYLIVTLIFMSLPGAVSGAVITESIFSWFGVVGTSWTTLKMDYPAAQGRLSHCFVCNHIKSTGGYRLWS